MLPRGRVLTLQGPALALSVLSLPPPRTTGWWPQSRDSGSPPAGCCRWPSLHQPDSWVLGDGSFSPYHSPSLPWPGEGLGAGVTSCLPPEGLGQGLAVRGLC